MIIRANCKINIGLDVLERRADGFHELSTVMFPVVGLYDEVEVERIDSSNVEFCSEGITIDCSSDSNLCVKAYRLMSERYGISGVRITLRKNIPFGAGLGGGSSDATVVILAINSLFELGLEESVLIDLAAELGSDTAFFVRNTPQLCTGRGEKMVSIDLSLRGYWLVLIKPDEGVSTREAYSGVKPAYPERPLSELIELPVEEWQGLIKNDFEPHIFEAHPLLATIKDDLLGAGALYASMSGSGSTIYALFSDECAAKSEALRGYTPYIFELE